MQWSLRAIFVFFLATSVALTLGRFWPVVSGITLAVVLTIACLVVPTRTWRCIAYGSVGGVVGAILLLELFVFIRLGRLYSSSYQQFDEVSSVTNPW